MRLTGADLANANARHQRVRRDTVPSRPGPLFGLSWCPVRSCGVLGRRPLEECLDHGVNSHLLAPLNALAQRLLKSGGNPVHEPVENKRT